MQLQKFRVKNVRQIIVSLVLSLVLGAFAGLSVRAQSSELNLADIMTALRSKKATAAEKNQLLTDGVRQRGVTFALNPDLEKELRAVGASDALVAAIRSKSPAPVVVATPMPAPTPAPKIEKPAFVEFQNKANQNLVLGEFGAAIADYGRAIELAPRETALYLGRALALSNVGDFGLAAADLSKALEINPDDAAVLAKRGAAYEKLNNSESAVRDYRRALELDPENAVAKAAVARIEASARVPEVEKPRVIVVQNKPVEPPMKTSGPAPMKNFGALNQFAERLTMPFYPPAERQRGTEGIVTVEVVLDEEGKVESSKAVSGPVVLRKAAEDAVRKSKFKPVTEEGVAVRATGFINFNFKVK